MDPEGWALDKGRESREMATSSETAGIPTLGGLLGSCGVLRALGVSVGLEKSPSQQQDSQRDRL